MAGLPQEPMDSAISLAGIYPHHWVPWRDYPSWQIPGMRGGRCRKKSSSVKNRLMSDSRIARMSVVSARVVRPLPCTKRVNPHKFVMGNPGNRYRMYLVRRTGIQPANMRVHLRDNLFLGRRGIDHLSCEPVPDYTPHIPERSLGFRIVQSILE